MGNDPFVRDPTRVYNTLVKSQTGMNQALCPDGMSYDDQGGLYNNMMDIAASPGMFKKSDGAASTDMALLAQLLGSEQGVARQRMNIGWRNESTDTLSKIKNRQDLERVIKELNDVRADLSDW
jgi:hypothetical protein